MAKSTMKRLLEIPYFHSYFRDIEEVLDVVAPYLTVDGCFLVRWSLSKKNTLAITVTDKMMVKHFNVLMVKDFLTLHDRRFHSMDDLYQFYSSHDVPNLEGHENIRLLHPIRAVRPFRRGKKMAPSHSVGNMSLKPAAASRNFRRTQTFNDLDMKVVKKKYKERNPSPHSPLISDSGEILKYDFQREVREQSDDPPELPARNSKNNTESPYYSVVRNNENVLDSVLEQLRMLEVADICVCGLPLSETDLADGWSVHLSTEPATRGMVFFNSPDGETSWQLPQQVVDKLSSSQRDFIRLAGMGGKKERRRKS